MLFLYKIKTKIVLVSYWIIVYRMLAEVKYDKLRTNE